MLTIKMWPALLLLSVIGCAVAGPPVSRSRDNIESFKTFLDKCRTDDGIRLESRMLANPKASPWENSGKLQGDILLNDEQAEVILQQYSQGRNAFIVPNSRWPDNTIVYEFSNVFTVAQENAIYAAMKAISDRTCIRFRRRVWRDRSFVRVTGRPDGCYANVGYSTFGVLTLNLALDTPGHGCFIHTVITHEWFHIVGFMHMQSTYNRDNYVRILWQNVEPGMEHNFDKFGPDLVDYMGLPYEYASNMHYDRYSASFNDQPTMLPIWNDHGLMGQLQFVTDSDYLRVNRHYNCPGAWSTPVNTEQLSEGINLAEEIMPLENNVVEDVFREDAVVEDIPQDTVSVVEHAPLE